MGSSSDCKADPRLELAPPLPARGALVGLRLGAAAVLLELGFVVTEGWRAALRPAQATAAAVLALDLLAALRRLEPRWPGRGTERPWGPTCAGRAFSATLAGSPVCASW